MSYIEKNLKWDEKIILNAQVSFVEYIRIFVVIIIGYICNFLLLLFISRRLGISVGAGYFFPIMILMYICLFNISNIELALTDKRIIGKYGVINI